MDKFDMRPEVAKPYKIREVEDPTIKVRGGVPVEVLCPFCGHVTRTSRTPLRGKGRNCDGCGAKHVKGTSYPAIDKPRGKHRRGGESVIPGISLSPHAGNAKQARLYAPGVGVGSEYDESARQFFAMPTWHRSAVINKARLLGLFDHIDRNWREYLGLENGKAEEP
jgi:hypothetical protein